LEAIKHRGWGEGEEKQAQNNKSNKIFLGLAGKCDICYNYISLRAIKIDHRYKNTRVVRNKYGYH